LRSWVPRTLCLRKHPPERRARWWRSAIGAVAGGAELALGRDCTGCEAGLHRLRAGLNWLRGGTALAAGRG